MWICLSDQKGELTRGHILFLLLTLLFAYQSGQSLYSGRGLQPKELSSASENFSILVDLELGLSLASQVLRKVTTCVHIFGLKNKAT